MIFLTIYIISTLITGVFFCRHIHKELALDRDHKLRWPDEGARCGATTYADILAGVFATVFPGLNSMATILVIGYIIISAFEKLGKQVVIK